MNDYTQLGIEADAETHQQTMCSAQGVLKEHWVDIMAARERSFTEQTKRANKTRPNWPFRDSCTKYERLKAQVWKGSRKTPCFDVGNRQLTLHVCFIVRGVRPVSDMNFVTFPLHSPFWMSVQDRP